MSEIWCNGQWLPADRYPGTAQDRGACFGLGLFETLLAIDGVPIFADRHLARLRQSCEKLGWTFGFPDFSAVVAELVARNDLATGRIRLRLIVTGGSGPLDDLAAGVDRLVWLSAFPAAEVPDSITLCLSPWPRNERSPLVGLKTACYAENLMALDHARQRGFQETIVLNTAGDLCEAATANVFLVKNGAILTPSLDSGCLPGIGREVVCEIAPAHGIPCEQRRLTLADLDAADEIFLTSSTRGPFPVSRFEERELPRSPLTAIVQRLWQAEISR
jgi:branched-chain amino acid aminotransferase